MCTFRTDKKREWNYTGNCASYEFYVENEYSKTKKKTNKKPSYEISFKVIFTKYRSALFTYKSCEELQGV